VHEVPYGRNSDRDDLMILFTDTGGSLTNKHAVIVTLASELRLRTQKSIGSYAMAESIVTGTRQILEHMICLTWQTAAD
jgi:hypothetical protein